MPSQHCRSIVFLMCKTNSLCPFPNKNPRCKGERSPLTIYQEVFGKKIRSSEFKSHQTIVPQRTTLSQDETSEWEKERMKTKPNAHSHQNPSQVFYPSSVKKKTGGSEEVQRTDSSYPSCPRAAREPAPRPDSRIDKIEKQIMHVVLLSLTAIHKRSKQNGDANRLADGTFSRTQNIA